MTCPCGYYSACSEGCTDERKSNIWTQQLANGMRAWKDRQRQLLQEHQKDTDEEDTYT